MSSDSGFSSGPSTSRRPVKSSPPPIDKPSHQQSTKKSSGQESDSLSLTGQLCQVLAIFVVASIVATSGFKSIEWLKRELKPFCESDNISQKKTTEDCIECPQNGFCQGGRLECFIGFKRVGKSCVNDKEIDQTAEKLASSLTRLVCARAAVAFCDGASGVAWITDEDAQARLKEESLQERLGLDEKSWTVVWEKMLSLVASRITIQNSSEGKLEFNCPGELVHQHKSVKCQIQDWVAANVFALFVISPAVVLLASVISRYLSRKKTNARAEQVYREVCEALEEKALESKEMIGGESWVVVSRLRDHILLPSERKWLGLWRQVESLVQEDSRIDQYQKKVKGEMKIVWEWQVEGALRTPGLQNKVRQAKKVQLQNNLFNVPSPQGNASSTQRDGR